MADKTDQDQAPSLSPDPSKYLDGIAEEMGQTPVEAPKAKAEEAKPAEEAPATPARDESGKFVKKDEPAKPEADDDLLDEDDETTKQPDKKNPEKKIEEFGYRLGNLEKSIEKIAKALERGDATPAQVKQLDKAQEAIDELAGRDEFDGLTVKDGKNIREDARAARELAEKLQQQLDETRQQNANEIWYTRKAAETGIVRDDLEKIVAETWAALRAKHPNTDDDGLKVAAETLVDMRISRAVKQKKAAVDADKQVPVPEAKKQPSPKPSTSTQGAKVTDGSGASRPQSDRAESEEEKLARYAGGIYEEFVGQH